MEAKDLNIGDLLFVPYLKSESYSNLDKDMLNIAPYFILLGELIYNHLNVSYKLIFKLDGEDEALKNNIEVELKKLFKNEDFKLMKSEEVEYDNGLVQFQAYCPREFVNKFKNIFNGEKYERISPDFMNMEKNDFEIFFESLKKISKNNTISIKSSEILNDLKMLMHKNDVLSIVEKKYNKKYVSKITAYSIYHWSKPPRISYHEIEYKLWDLKFDIKPLISNEKGYFLPITNISSKYLETNVYNFEVNNTNTYLVQGVAVHNCSAPSRDENQLHAAVVELVTHDNAEIKYSTVQNWFPGDEQGKGGIYNFVTKRALCSGVNSKVMWTQVETGSAITWKYPSCILKGDGSIGEFYSVAITNNAQQADTGTKMIHIGKNTRSRVVSKGVSAGNSRQTYRGLVSIKKGAVGAKNKTQCDSMILGDKCIANTIPYIENENSFSKIEHEATVSKVDEEKLFYLMQRGISEENAVALLVTGFCKEVMQVLPAEFAYEAAALIELSVEGAVG